MSDRTFNEAFSDWWALLQDRFGTEKPATVAAFYHRTLESQLTLAELEKAMAEVAYANAYFPSPKEIVEAAHGSDEVQAAEQWKICQRVMRGHPEDLERMSPAGRKTVELLGGAYRLGLTKLDAVPFIRKEFMRLHGHATEIHRRESGEKLPPWSKEGREIAEVMKPKRLLGRTDNDAA